MVIKLGAELEAALTESARQQGLAPEDLAVQALRQQFLAGVAAITPRDEWERRLLNSASDCGVGLSHAAVSSEGLYD